MNLASQGPMLIGTPAGIDTHGLIVEAGHWPGGKMYQFMRV